MDIISFVHYFNLVKPDIEEIKKAGSSISDDIAFGLTSEYDLKVTSMNLYQDPIIDLIENTNISDLNFSQFHFYKPKNNNSSIKIGSIEEKGRLFLDIITKEIVFIDMYESGNDCRIDQRNFLAFLIKFWEFDFNRIYKRENTNLNITKNLLIDIKKVKMFYVFDFLMKEINMNL